MATDRKPRLVIAGGGLAGSLAALAVALRTDVELLLLEQGESFGGNHIWSFFDADIAEVDRWLVEPMIAQRWPDHDISFPSRRRTLPLGYNSIRSDLLDRVVRERLRPDQYRLSAGIAAVEPDGVTLEGGERIAATATLDARGPAGLDALDLGWQKFVGRDYVLDAPHGLDRPIVMDATVDQTDGYRFVYCLPFADNRLLIEDTYYSTDPALDRAAIGARIEAYAAARGWRPVSIENEEQGVLPVAMGGDFDVFWPAEEKVARIGLRGGFFHPTTGYSLPDAVRTAMVIGRQQDLPALAEILRAEAARLWRDRAFYRLLNRMLFRAAAPELRYRVLEHFYRLDPGLIARFYAGRSTLADKLRMLSGRPPVPVTKALAAAWA